MNIGIDLDDDNNSNKNYIAVNSSSSSSSSNSNNNSNNIKLNIKNAEDTLLVVDVSPKDTIDHLKSLILERKAKKAHKIRLIYNGKMLIDSNSIEESKLTNGCFIICSITAPLNLSPTIAELPHDAILNATPPTPSISTSQPTSLNVNNNILYDPTTNSFRTNDDIILEMENFRMNQDTVEELEFMSLQTNIVRDSLELIFGMAFGFFFGPISLFWLSKDYLARSIKFGIIIGVSLNVLIGLSSVTSQ
ncbi:hypothetical protein PPL_01547 [Heterostelium album PN500]|uniref:Ubiquitin-like domain-containing protein n=1 Tax=Heterostelium pallidum (strain ATCC 26659 / Pp 5 / PN500) TaxID=670386 RepID=D3AZT4_HETP5|nr:hypothetical protein PPL_01547 [Heterostelium album PN500]EFA84558.1 hypothetical protein PPL_01547 [Heterostelium album PN500]|eukprot:XP_020436671.1 hypothetical protein PPL_01547 [Heterostelium album PN500]